MHSRIVKHSAWVCMIFATHSIAGYLAPDALDKLLLPESGAGERFSILFENRGDSLVDLVLSHTTDSRFEIGTNARNQLWIILSEVTDQTNGMTIWRQDQLDELAVALDFGSVEAKLSSADAMSRAIPALQLQARTILIDRALLETDVYVLTHILHAASRYQGVSSDAQNLLFEQISEGTHGNSAAIEASSDVYRSTLFKYGRDDDRYKLDVQCARVVLQSKDNAVDALNAINGFDQSKHMAIAEAMASLSLQDGSVYFLSDEAGRIEWITALRDLLLEQSSEPYVRCCLLSAALGLYANQSVPPEIVTDMLVAPFETHSVNPVMKQMAASYIEAADSNTAVPQGWDNE